MRWPLARERPGGRQDLGFLPSPPNRATHDFLLNRTLSYWWQHRWDTRTPGLQDTAAL